jgi:hypothetical protein
MEIEVEKEENDDDELLIFLVGYAFFCVVNGKNTIILIQ